MDYIHKIIGINTIGTSLGGREPDIKKPPFIPKNIISPWTFN